MTSLLGTDSRAVTPAVTHVLTIAMTSLLVIGLLATAGSFLDNEEQRNAREDLQLIGNRLADEVSRVDALARNGGEASIETRHPSEVSGGGYAVVQRYGSDCPDSDSCLELRSHELDIEVSVPLYNTTDVFVESAGSNTFVVTGNDPDPTDDFEGNPHASGLSLRVGVASDVTDDPLGTRLTTRNEPPIPRLDVNPDPPSMADWSYLNGTGSYDPDGNISEYKWDVGADGLYTERGEVAPYWFDEPGRHEVELRTADDAEETAATSARTNVTVSGLEYRHDLREGGPSAHTDSIRYSFHNNWSEPIRLDSIFLDGPDGIDELGDCDNDHSTGGDFDSEVSIDTDGDGDRDFYYEVEDLDSDIFGDGDCEPGLPIPDNGLVLNVDQQPNPAYDIDTNVDNDGDVEVPMVNRSDNVTIEIAGLEDDMDGDDWRLGVSYLRNSLSSETVVEDSVGAPHVTNFSVDADDDSVDVTIESEDELGTIEFDHGDNESSSTHTGKGDHTEPGDIHRYVVEDVASGVSGHYWAELTSVTDQSTDVQAYELPPRDSAVAADTPDDAGWRAQGDWDINARESNVVHEDLGDQVEDRVALGYNGTDLGGNNLTAYWAMDDAGGDTMVDHRDASTTLDGETTDIFDGTVGLFGTSSYAFTEDSDRVDVDLSKRPGGQNQLSGGDDATITVSTWVHPRRSIANSDGSAVIGKLDTTAGEGGDWSIVVEDDCPGYAEGGCDGTPTIGYYAGTDTDEFALLHGPITQEDTWHHVAFVLDEENDELSLYYDGRLEERVTGAPDFFTANTSEDVVVGEHPATGENFDGYVDETRIYNRTLSGVEIRRLADTTRSGGFTTTWRNGTGTYSPDEVNLSAALDLNGADVTVTVESNESEQSDPIRLRDGNDDYDVTGLSSSADGWRLHVDVESSSPIMTPEIDKLVVHDQP